MVLPNNRVNAYCYAVKRHPVCETLGKKGNDK